MIKTILLTAITSLSLTGLGTVNTAKAEPSGAYIQQTNHAPNTRYAREHRDYRPSHFYGGGSYSAPWYGYDNRRNRGFRRSHHSHNNGNLVLGIGLGLLTYQLIKSAEPRHQTTYRTTYVQPYSRPPAPTTVVYVQQPQTQQARTTCLQTREYQTVVIIGGAERNAYGTACLQPDGSWLQGPATAEPNF